MKRNVGKLCLFAIGYSTTEGAQILPIRESVTDIFDLPNKEMAEASENLLLSQSEEQASSTDCVNRQKSIPDWASTP